MKTKEMSTVNGQEMEQLGSDKPKNAEKQSPVFIKGSGLTLELLSKVTELPLEFYEEFGLREVKRDHVSTIYIPYFDQHGEYVTAGYLTRLSGKTNGARSRFSKPIPYGWWQIFDIQEEGWTLLVKGELDYWVVGIMAYRP